MTPCAPDHGTPVAVLAMVEALDLVAAMRRAEMDLSRALDEVCPEGGRIVLDMTDDRAEVSP